MKPTNEQVNEVARAMWDANSPNDGTPEWDNLLDIDEAVKGEMRVMARAAIRKWHEISKG